MDLDVLGSRKKARMKLKDQAVSGVKWSGISMIAATVLQFFTTAVLSRLISPTDFGLMGMIMVVIGFAQLFSDMGISNAIIYRQDTTKDQLSSLYWLNIVVGVVIFCCVFASTPLIESFYGEHRLTHLAHLIALTFLITPFGQQFQILLQKELQFNRLAKIEIATFLVYPAVTISLASLGYGVFSLAWGFLGSATMKVLLLCAAAWNDWHPRLHFAKHDLQGYLSFGVFQMGERAINYLNSNFDYLLIGSLLGADSLGYYTLAYSLIIKPYTIINPVINKVAFPVFSKIQRQTEQLKRGFLRTIQILATVNFPLMTGIAAVAPVAVPVLLGEEWTPSIILIQILVVVGLLRSTGNPIGSLLLAKGRADLAFKWNLGLVATQFPGLYLGMKIGGMVGLAAALAILQCIYTFFAYIILVRLLLGPCLREYVASMWPALWMSAAMGLIVSSIHNCWPAISSPIMLTLQTLTGAVVLFIMMLRWQGRLLKEMKNLIFTGALAGQEK